MKNEKWHEDQPVLRDDLVRAQETKEDAIRERLTDIFNPGVLLDSQLTGESEAFLVEQGPSAGLFVTVNTGVGFSPAGERIIVPTVSAYNASAPITTTDNGIGGTTLTPQSTGTQNIPVTNNATNSIWIGYLETTDAEVFSLSESTNERLFVKHDDGYRIAVTTTSVNPDSSRYILLAEVVTLAGIVTSISTSLTRDSATTGAIVVPGSPYQVTLAVLPNLPNDQHPIASIPAIAGFTYVTSAPAAGEFTVDFSAGVVTFNAANAGASITIVYTAAHIRRQYSLTKSSRAAAHLSLNEFPTVYEAGSIISLTDHVNARGSGLISSVNPHGLTPADIGLSGITELGGVLASKGVTIESADASTFSSALSPSAVSAFVVQDNIVAIAPLVAGEAVNISGTTVNSTNVPSQVLFNFVDAMLSPIAAGTYYFYVDKTTRLVTRALGAAPSDSFPIASIVWDGAKLLLPITDLRTFGTASKANIRLETLLALATGAATDNRTSVFYKARLIGATAVTSPTYAFTGLGGTTLNVTVDGTPDSVTFAALPANTTISQAVAAINSQMPSVLATKTLDNRIKLLAALSLTITGGSSAPILGFATGQTDNETASFVVSAANNKIDFKVNAGPQLTATLTNGTYVMGTSNADPDSLCEEVKTQMEVADPAGIYSVTFNPSTLKVTISRNSGTFQILWATGTNTANAADALLGFTTTDTAIAISITSDSTTASPAYASTNSNIKEIRISGSSSSVGVGGETVSAEVSFAYDISVSTKLVRVDASMGNKILTTEITYNSDDSIRSVQETVS